MGSDMNESWLVQTGAQVYPSSEIWYVVAAFGPYTNLVHSVIRLDCGEPVRPCPFGWHPGQSITTAWLFTHWCKVVAFAVVGNTEALPK